MQLHFHLWDPFNFINSLLPTSSDQVSGGELWKFQGVINQSTNQLLYGCVDIHSSNDRSYEILSYNMYSLTYCKGVAKIHKNIKQLWFPGVVVCDICWFCQRDPNWNERVGCFLRSSSDSEPARLPKSAAKKKPELCYRTQWDVAAMAKPFNTMVDISQL